MKRKAGLLFLLPLLLVPIAYATPPVTATGSFTTSDVIVASRSANGNTIFTLTTTIAWTSGPFAGTTTAAETFVLHPGGTFNFHGKGTFTGTVAGNTGTATETYEGHGSVSCGCYQVSTVFSHGTGSLAGLHAEGTFPGTITGAFTSAGTYSLQYHFD